MIMKTRFKSLATILLAALPGGEAEAGKQIARLRQKAGKRRRDATDEVHAVRDQIRDK